jgi:hypothetical protein
MTAYLKTGKGYVEITQAHINRVARRIRARRIKTAQEWVEENYLKTSKQGGE